MGRVVPIVLAAMLLSAASWLASCGSRKPLLVLLISIDTLRTDRLGSYGGKRGLTPAIDRLAADGILFERTYSTSSWTSPAMGSIFTGTYATQHGLNRMNRRLDPKLPTLAQRLRAAGFYTAGIPSHLLLFKRFGFHAGFDEYHQEHRCDHQTISSAVYADLAIRILEEHQNEDLFLWVHFFDPHYNYRIHPRYQHLYSPELGEYRGKHYDIDELKCSSGSLLPEEYRTLAELYDGEVAFTDEHIGRVLTALRESGRYDDALIVCVADHGEELGEHGTLGHTAHPWDTVIRVPLIIKPPGARCAGRVAETASLVDLYATILLQSGVTPGLTSGIDLLQEQLPRDRVVFADTFVEEASFSVAVDESSKVIFFPEDKRTLSCHYYPTKRVREGLEFPDLETLRKAHLREAVGDSTPGEPLDARQRAILKSLGYLD